MSIVEGCVWYFIFIFYDLGSIFHLRVEDCLIGMCFTGFLQNKESLTVLVVGKGGVGKSSTVNSIVGERVTVVSAFQVTDYSHLKVIF